MPIPPGFVSETLAPARSSAVSLLSRALAIRSLKACEEVGEGSRPASRMTGTISVREPSFFSTSTAMPRLTRAVVDAVGLPSRSSKWWAMTGISSVAARAIA